MRGQVQVEEEDGFGNDCSFKVVPLRKLKKCDTSEKLSGWLKGQNMGQTADAVDRLDLDIKSFTRMTQEEPSRFGVQNREELDKLEQLTNFLKTGRTRGASTNELTGVFLTKDLLEARKCTMPDTMANFLRGKGMPQAAEIVESKGYTVDNIKVLTVGDFDMEDEPLSTIPEEEKSLVMKLAWSLREFARNERRRSKNAVSNLTGTWETNRNSRSHTPSGLGTMRWSHVSERRLDTELAQQASSPSPMDMSRHSQLDRMNSIGERANWSSRLSDGPHQTSSHVGNAPMLAETVEMATFTEDELAEMREIDTSQALAAWFEKEYMPHVAIVVMQNKYLWDDITQEDITTWNLPAAEEKKLRSLFQAYYGLSAQDMELMLNQRHADTKMIDTTVTAEEVPQQDYDEQTPLNSFSENGGRESLGIRSPIPSPLSPLNFSQQPQPRSKFKGMFFSRADIAALRACSNSEEVAYWFGDIGMPYMRVYVTTKNITVARIAQLSADDISDMESLPGDERDKLKNIVFQLFDLEQYVRRLNLMDHETLVFKGRNLVFMNGPLRCCNFWSDRDRRSAWGRRKDMCCCSPRKRYELDAPRLEVFKDRMVITTSWWKEEYGDYDYQYMFENPNVVPFKLYVDNIDFSDVADIDYSMEPKIPKYFTTFYDDWLRCCCFKRMREPYDGNFLWVGPCRRLFGYSHVYKERRDGEITVTLKNGSVAKFGVGIRTLNKEKSEKDSKQLEKLINWDKAEKVRVREGIEARQVKSDTCHDTNWFGHCWEGLLTMIGLEKRLEELPNTRSNMDFFSRRGRVEDLANLLWHRVEEAQIGRSYKFDIKNGIMR